MIEYPGLVNNEDAMIETLGGNAKISQVLKLVILWDHKPFIWNFQTFCGELKRLELRFHPKNPFNKSAYAEANPRIGLLLSIQIRKSKKRGRISQYRVEIVGHCKSSFVFDCKHK